MNRFSRRIFLVPSLLIVSISHSPAAGTISEPLADSGPSSSRFGFSLAVSHNSLFVGAPFFDVAGASDSGDVFAFDTTTLTYTGTFGSALGSSSKDGASLAGGSNDLLVGSPGYASSAGFANYWRPGAGAGIWNPAPAANDEFGRAVAMSKNQLIIGAPGDAGGPGAALSGSAFYGRKRDHVPVRLPLPNYTTGDQAGSAVAASSKMIAVGSRGAASGSTPNSGAVHLYDAKTHVYRLTLSAVTPFASPRFGESVAFAGKYLFIGAPAQDTASPVVPGSVAAAGAVYQFDVKTMSLVHTYFSPTPQTGAGFGTSISADRKHLLVGSPNFDQAFGTDAGGADLFDLKTTAYVMSPLSGSPATSENFGQTVVLLKGNRMAISAPAPDSPDNDGHVYVRAITP
jgi:hypothetical protein